MLLLLLLLLLLLFLLFSWLKLPRTWTSQPMFGSPMLWESGVEKHEKCDWNLLFREDFFGVLGEEIGWRTVRHEFLRFRSSGPFVCAKDPGYVLRIRDFPFFIRLWGWDGSTIDPTRSAGVWSLRVDNIRIFRMFHDCLMGSEFARRISQHELNTEFIIPWPAKGGEGVPKKDEDTCYLSTRNCLISPLPEEMIQFDIYFSDGLKRWNHQTV